jgi:adenylosuccinate lyase
MPNLALSGNARYQPKDLIPIFGYDNLAGPLVEVELATMDTLAEMGVIPEYDYKLLTPEIREKLLAITTTEIDKVEREITKHDIRALVRIMQEILPEPLRRWVHVPLTSFDPLDTARTLQFIRSYRDVVRPKTHEVIRLFRNQSRRTNHIVQIGRTHGQHAMPIRVGFWFATILSRVLSGSEKMEEYAGGLVGKISGAVGAYNAQIGLRIVGGSRSFEYSVLARLGLQPARISTQILPPEPLAFYLFSALTLSSAFAQFARDSRHLMRSEIGELREPFEKEQVGSSTMAHKRNPVTFEGIESAYLKTKSEFGKVLDNLISEHQRDLVGSALSRDFPTIIVNLTTQLDMLLRPNKDDGRPFLESVTIDEDACRRNLEMAGDKILAEPMYLGLQMAGYAGDAHEVINHRAMPLMRPGFTLVNAVEQIAEGDSEVKSAWRAIPDDLHRLFRDPKNYTGLANEKAEEVCRRADAHLSR